MAGFLGLEYWLARRPAAFENVGPGGNIRASLAKVAALPPAPGSLPGRQKALTIFLFIFVLIACALN
jgi:hypothetical protein